MSKVWECEGKRYKECTSCKETKLVNKFEWTSRYKNGEKYGYFPKSQCMKCRNARKKLKKSRSEKELEEANQ